MSRRFVGMMVVGLVCGATQAVSQDMANDSRQTEPADSGGEEYSAVLQKGEDVDILNRYGHRNAFLENVSFAQRGQDSFSLGKVHFFVTLNENYDDNIDNAYDAKLSDWITTVSAGALYTYPATTEKPIALTSTNTAIGLTESPEILPNSTGRSSLMLGYTLQYQHYADNSERDEFSHGTENGLEGFMTYNLGKGRSLGLLGHFSNSYDPMRTTDSGEQDSFNTYRGTLSLDWPFNSRFGAGLGYSRAYVDYEEDYTEFKDRIDDTYSITADYFYSPKTTLYLGYDFDHAEYDTNTVNSNDRHRLYLGMNWRATQKTSVGARVGVDSKSFTDNPFNPEDDSTLAFNLNAAHRLTSKSMLSVSAGKSLHEAAVEDASGSDNWNAGLGYTLMLTEKLSTALSFSYLYDDYQYFENDRERTDQDYSISPSLSYQLRDWLSLGVSYCFTQRDSSIEQYGYDKNEFWLQLGADF